MAKRGTPGPGSPAKPTDVIEKVTLALGADTVERLDKIVKRGRFGSRGRALDALLDDLDHIVDDVVDWQIAFDHSVDKKSDTRAIEQAEDEMMQAAIRAWSKIERFVAIPDD